MPLSRRQFIRMSVAGAAGYGLVRGVRKVRNAARRSADT